MICRCILLAALTPPLLHESWPGTDRAGGGGRAGEGGCDGGGGGDGGGERSPPARGGLAWPKRQQNQRISEITWIKVRVSCRQSEK